MTDTVTAAEVLEALKRRYAAPAYAILPQVRNGTGFARAVRTADAIVMGLYPSRGLELMGIEIKVHRGDWLQECRQPEKAESIAQYCDRWWVVASADIVQPGELPAPWGLLVLANGKLKVAVQATLLKAQPVDRVFLAALLRKVHESLNPLGEARRIREEARQQGLKDGHAQAIHDAEDRFRSTAEAVRAFEKASGIRIGDDWRAGEIGAAVKILMHEGPAKIARQLKDLSETARFLHESTARALKDFQEIGA